MLGPIVRGERVSLEPLRAEDLPLIRAWSEQPEFMHYLYGRALQSEEQQLAAYRSEAEDRSVVAWRMVAEGRTVGETALKGIDWVNRHAASRLSVDPACWSNGYASEAVRLRTDFAFLELGLERLDTSSVEENKGMHRALEKAGYTRYATQRRFMYHKGRWHDLYLFELLREDWVKRRELES